MTATSRRSFLRNGGSSIEEARPLSARSPLVFFGLESRVWFAGSYTREVDGQDTALLSAMSVVRELDPQAPNLLALESTLGP